MSSKYAQGTTVSIDRTLAAIRRRLADHDCSAFSYAEELDALAPRVAVRFRIEGMMVQVVIPMPPKDDIRVTHTPAGKARTTLQADDFREKEHRRRWRSIELLIKAKLEGIALGCTTIEREFLADLVLPAGDTVGERFAGKLQDVLAGAEPMLLIPEVNP